MAGRDVRAASAALTVDGTAGGYVTVADASVFFAKARASLKNPASSEGVEVEIASVDPVTDQVGLRLVRDHTRLQGPRYGRDPMGAYAIAGGWVLYMPAQLIYEA